MTDTPIADMVEQMFAADVAPAVIVAAIRTTEIVAAATVTTRHDAVTTPSRSREAERAARYRENRKQIKANAKANDVASAENRERDIVTTRHDASLFALHTIQEEGLSIEEGRSSKKKKKEGSENARARGQRMVVGALLTDDYRNAAIELGADPQAVPAIWAEFVDYWADIPGQRGVKIRWLGTWRNRVRAVLERGKPNGQHKQQRQSLSDLAGELAEQARSAERARGIG